MIPDILSWPESGLNDLMEKTVAGLDAAKDLKPGESKILESSWSKIDHPPTTTKENIEQSQFWSQIGWALIEEDENRNMDLVPSHFDRLLTDGCPECKSAWIELLAIGFTTERAYAGEAKWNGRHFDISTLPIHHLGNRAVRVRCFSGHAFDFDSFTKRVRKHEIPSWAVMGLLGVGALAAYWAFSKMKKSGEYGK